MVFDAIIEEIVDRYHVVLRRERTNKMVLLLKQESSVKIRYVDIMFDGDSTISCRGHYTHVVHINIDIRQPNSTDKIFQFIEKFGTPQRKIYSTVNMK